jgi:hypothetical protein
MSNLGGTVSAMDHICPLTTTIYRVPYVTNYEFPSHPTNFHDEVINHVAFISNFFNMQMSYFQMKKQMSGKMVINQTPKHGIYWHFYLEEARTYRMNRYHDIHK